MQWLVLVRCQQHREDQVAISPRGILVDGALVGSKGAVVATRSQGLLRALGDCGDRQHWHGREEFLRSTLDDGYFAVAPGRAVHEQTVHIHSLL